MIKPKNELTDFPNGHDDATPPLTVAESKAPPLDAEAQLAAFRELAGRLYTESSAERFEAALRTLLLPLKKPQGDEATAQPPPTHNRES